MKIALAQINPTPGDLRGNARKIADFAHRARQQEAELVVFPELCVTGYSPQDLLENSTFLDAVERALEHVAQEVPPDVGIVVGAPVPNPARTGKPLFNAALLYEGGRRVAAVHKRLLPTYDVYDEARYFEPAGPQPVVAWRGLRLGVNVCEDMWNGDEQAARRLYAADPLAELAARDADLFINVSASPFAAGKHALRTEVVRAICRTHGRPFVLVNQVGANADVIFDGDSRVHGADGTLVRCAPSFEEALLVWDTDTGGEAAAVPHDDVADLHDALRLGIRDYVDKTGAFKKALVGLSGGIDSAVTCALAVAALGPEKVVGVTMPSRYSSVGSIEDAAALARNLGITLHHVPIAPAVDAFDAMLADVFAGTDSGVAEENIQARARGVTLMALSNKFDYLLLATGNKSEMAVGYATLYGDMNGGLAVLADVFKTQVYALAHHVNRQAGRDVIPRSSITKPPSAELRPGQTDQDTLPPYEVLDEILRLYVEASLEMEAIVARTGYDRALVHDVLRRVDRNEYKRRQAPPGLRVSTKAFGAGRRLPLAARWEREG